MIRKATTEDLSNVAALYQELHAYHDTHRNYCNWDKRIYPVRATAEDAEKRGFLYVCEREETPDGESGGNGNPILAAVILNHIQPEEYRGVSWETAAEGEEVFVIHTLVVSPRARKQGLGKKMVSFAEALGKSLGCKVMRFDTSAFNKPAYTLYTGLGYRVAGKTLVETSESMIQMLYCFEKKLCDD